MKNQKNKRPLTYQSKRGPDKNPNYDFLFEDNTPPPPPSPTHNVYVVNAPQKFGIINTIAVAIIIICMALWTLVFLTAAVATKSPTIMFATTGSAVLYWALTWFLYWLGWKYYWILLAIGWICSTLYLFTIASAITEALFRFF